MKLCICGVSDWEKATVRRVLELFEFEDIILEGWRCRRCKRDYTLVEYFKLEEAK